MPSQEPYGVATRRLRIGYAVGAGLTIAVFSEWIRSDWGGDLATRSFVDLASTAFPALAAVLCVMRARRVPGERGLAWWLVGGGCLSWSLGQVAWSWLELVQRVKPFPSLADVGYLGLLLLAAAALMGMVVGTTAVTSRLRTLLDGLLIASALLFLSRALFLRPIVAYAAQQEGAVAQVLSLAYPLGDLVLLSLILLLASRVHRAVRPTLLWLGLALLALAAADVGYAYLNAIGTYVTGSPSDVGWVVAFAIIGYAALRPIPLVPDHVPPAPGVLLSVLPLAPFLVATVVSLFVEVREGALEPFLFWNAIVVIGLLTARQFVILLENIALRRAVEGSLADLQAAQAARTQMLNNITHDLVSPLTPVRLQVRLLETMGPLSEKQVQAVKVIRRNVEQVVSMVGDLKDMANLDAGRLRLDLQDVDGATLLRQAVETMAAQAMEHGVELVAEGGGPAALRADSTRLSQVLMNLIGNAIKFTPPDGRVTARVMAADGTVTFTVNDTGRGISAADQNRLFRAFSQVHDRAQMPASERGTGLGLYICRGIVEGHGGSIAVSSDGLGKGATFTVTLPATGPAPSAPR